MNIKIFLGKISLLWGVLYDIILYDTKLYQKKRININIPYTNLRAFFCTILYHTKLDISFKMPQKKKNKKLAKNKNINLYSIHFHTNWHKFTNFHTKSYKKPPKK